MSNAYCTCGEVWAGHPNSHALTCPLHAFVDESLRIEWEQATARQAMDAGPICTCGHAQLDHGETRCKHCGCGLAWCAHEFAR